MHRRILASLLLLLAVPCAAQSPADGGNRVLLQAHASLESPSEVDGWIDYFQGTDPLPPYRESVGAGLGGGALLGYHFTRHLEIALGMDLARHRGGRGGVSRGQTLHQAQATARLLLPATWPGRLGPFVALSLQSRRLEEPSVGANVPWPGTSALSGRATAAGVGVRRLTGGRVALEALAEVVTSRFGRVEVGGAGAFDKATHTGRAVGTRLSAGVSWYPWGEPAASPPVPAGWSVAADQYLRAYTSDTTVVGTVVAVRGDGMTVQTANGNTLHQIVLPFACLTRVDLHRRRQGQGPAVLESALQGALVSTALLMGLERLHGADEAVHPARLVLVSAAPGAVAGAVLGIFRSRDRWVQVPLPAQVSHAAPESAPSCEADEEAEGR